MMRGYSAQEMVIQFGYVTMFAASFGTMLPKDGWGCAM